jgi:dinuclear metal center YbgI/SA1388 family protein
MAKLQEIVRYTNDLLNIDMFKDYCPNGLQVEGKESVKHLVSAVTASQSAIDRAIEAGADALLVHHGYFWRGEDQTITGIKRQRIQSLLNANVSLLAYHLPLDAHPEVGNNAQLAKILEIQVDGTLQGKAELVMSGHFDQPVSANDLCLRIENAFNRAPLHIRGHGREIKTVAWCSGGAQSYFEYAIDAGVDAYITGEASEQNYHLAKEYGVDFFASGHHASERYGVQALGELLAKQFSISHKFIDINNPI